MQSIDPWISSAMVMAMSIYRTLCVLVFNMKNWELLINSLQSLVILRSFLWWRWQRASKGHFVFLFFFFFLKISLLEMPISFGNEHLTSKWSPMTTPWPPTDLPEPLIDLPWPSTDLPLTSYDFPLNSHDLPWLFIFWSLFFFFFLKISLLEMLIAFGNEHPKIYFHSTIWCKKKMLKNGPDDALGLLVKLENLVKLFNLAKPLNLELSHTFTSWDIYDAK